MDKDKDKDKVDIQKFKSFVEICLHSVQNGSLQKRVDLQSEFLQKDRDIRHMTDVIRQKELSNQDKQLTESKLHQNIYYANHILNHLCEETKNLQDLKKNKFDDDFNKFNMFDQRSKQLDGDLQKLNSQFEEEVLGKDILEVTNTLQIYREIKDKCNKKLQNNTKKKAHNYQKITAISSITKQIGKSKNIEEIQRKTSEHETNIKFLSHEIAQITMYLSSIKLS